jgi:hypothetical protein
LRARVPALAERLTACAGIVFIKANQPFHLANHLAERLCARAKAASGRTQAGGAPKPASLAFARITTSVLDETVRRYALGNGQSGRLGAEAYFVGAKAPAPRWGDLRELTELLARPVLARGPVRQLFTLLGQDAADAKRRYARWREVLGGSEANSGLLREFDGLLGRFGERDARLPFVNVAGTEPYTPLSDALALRAVGYVPAGAEAGSHD